MNAHRKALIKLLRDTSYRHNLYDVFRDFVAASACALANACDPVGRDAREEQYLRVMARYTKDEAQQFPRMLGELVEAFDLEPGDVLGSVFGELELHNEARGQFFTPYHLCVAMAAMTVSADDARALIAERGFFTVQEPACGAGAMVIALADYLRGQGINYQQHMHVTAIDVDERAVHMAYVQFALLHIPAVVVLGNTITLETREVWHTPAHIMGLWDRKLARGYALGSAMDQAPPVDPAPVIAPPAVVLVRQPDLFEVAA